MRLWQVVPGPELPLDGLEARGVICPARRGCFQDFQDKSLRAPIGSRPTSRRGQQRLAGALAPNLGSVRGLLGFR